MKLNQLNELIIALLSFLGGLLSFAGTLSIYQSSNIGIIKNLQLKYRLKKAYIDNDTISVKILTILLYEVKLYSSNPVKQATAIASLLQIEKERAFEIFIERLGGKPKLSVHIKGSLTHYIKILAQTI